MCRSAANRESPWCGAGLGVDQAGDRVVQQLNANPADPGRSTSYTGDSVETQDRTDGATKATRMPQAWRSWLT